MFPMCTYMALRSARSLWPAEAFPEGHSLSHSTQPSNQSFLLTVPLDIGGTHCSNCVIPLPVWRCSRWTLRTAPPCSISSPTLLGWERPWARMLQTPAASTSSAAVFKHKHFSDCCMLLDELHCVEMVVFINLCSFIIDFWREDLPASSLGCQGSSASPKYISSWQCCGQMNGGRGEVAGYEAMKVGRVGETSLSRGRAWQPPCGKGFSQVLKAQSVELWHLNLVLLTPSSVLCSFYQGAFTSAIVV